MGVPQTLPANFDQWDKTAGPPATLPKDFDQWDQASGKKDYWGNSASEVSNFLSKNPGYQFLDVDPKFPNRRPGIYPAGQGGAWRTDPNNPTSQTDQFPVDVHGMKHTYEGAKAGAMAATAPLALEATLPQLVGGVAGGAVGSVAGQQIAKSAGAGETGQEVAGDVGGIVGGSVTGAAGDWAATKARAIYSALPDALQKEMIGIVSPRAAHAIKIAESLGFGKAVDPAYPGAPLPAAPAPEVLQASSLGRGPQAVSDPAAALANIPARAVYPGAPLPATPAPEQLNPSLVSPARTLPGQISPEAIRPPASPIPARYGLQLPGDAPPGAAGSMAASVETPEAPSGAGMPRTLSGDSALRQILGGQDNANLLKIAKSRGINVTQEAQLKPGVADGRLIDKIVNDYSGDELDNVRSTYLENTRLAKHDFGDIGPEAWKTMSLQTYFPDVKIPTATLKRVSGAVSNAAKSQAAPISDDDLLQKLQESVRQATASKLQTQ